MLTTLVGRRLPRLAGPCRIRSRSAQSRARPPRLAILRASQVPAVAEDAPRDGSARPVIPAFEDLYIHLAAAFRPCPVRSNVYPFMTESLRVMRVLCPR